MKKIKIAVLMTIHNRMDQTLKCIEFLNKNSSKWISIDIFIADSGTVDNSLINKYFSNCFIKKINNDLYWNQGMIIAWELAINSNKNFNFFLLLNDDTFLKPKALSSLINDHKSVDDQSNIIVGTTSYKDKISYGGRNKINLKPVMPNGKPQKVRYMNGNCVLIPYSVFLKVGNLNNRYSHSLGDIDYSIRATKKNVSVLIGSEIIGECKPNKTEWYSNRSFFERVKQLNNPKGFPFNEYLYFNFKNLGLYSAIKLILSTLIILIDPILYSKIKSFYIKFL